MSWVTDKTYSQGKAKWGWGAAEEIKSESDRPIIRWQLTQRMKREET